MSLTIKDGGGTGNEASVTTAGQVKVIAESHSTQFHHSLENEAAYQVTGDFASINNSTHALIHFKNTSTTKIVIVTYLRMQMLDFAGGAAVPNVATYFSLGFGRTYGSGGTAVTPVNMNRGSGLTADATVYDNNPTLAGTFTEIDRWYVQGEGIEQTYNKEGTIILSQNDTFEIRVTSDHTSGVAHARMSFLQIDPAKLT